MGCGWASVACYLVMTVVSYLWGQKHYPVPYEWKKLSGYLMVIVLITVAHQWLNGFFHSLWLSIATGALLMGGFMIYTLLRDRREFSRLPVVGRFLA